MKKSNEIFASANFPVIVARSKNSREDIKVRTFSCKDSGVAVISNYMANPYSPITGGKLAPQDKKLLTLTAAEVDKLEELGVCPNCGAELRAHASVANSLENAKFHCVVCGEELMVEESGDPEGFLDKLAENYDEAEDKMDTTAEETTQMIDKEIDPATADEPSEPAEVAVEEVVIKSSEVEDKPAEEEAEDQTTQMENVEAEVTDELPESAANDPETTQMEPVEADITEELPESAADDAETTQMDTEAGCGKVESEEGTEEDLGEEFAPETVAEETTEEAPAEETPEAPAEDKDEEIRVDMLSRCQAGLNTKKIEVVSSGKPTFYYVMVANKPVATLHRSRAIAEVQDIFDNKNLLTQALVASIEKDGINKTTLSNFGLVPMILKVKASEAVQKAVDDKVAEMTTQMEAASDQLEEDYQQSLGIAAVAVNKNLFDDTKNVLAEDLIENLEGIGVEDARDIVESSFKKCGEEYLRTIVAKAHEFKNKSADVRNELANTVIASNFKSGKINMEHKAVASVKESLKDEEVAKYRSLFAKK